MINPSDLERQEFSQQLELMNTGVSNAQRENIQHYLSPLGFTIDHLQERQRMIDDLDELGNNQHVLKSKKVGLRFDRDDLIEEVDLLYTVTRTIVKATIKDKAVWIELGIHKKKEKVHCVSSWLVQCDHFYRNFTPEIIRQVQFRGVTKERIREEKALVARVAELEQRRLDTGTAALRATVEKNRALKEMQLWMRDFYKLAKIGLRESPELLPYLGIRRG